MSTLFNCLHAQELGIKLGSSFIKNNSTINKPANIGIYYNEKISDKINISTTYLHSIKKQENAEIDFQTNFKGHNIFIDFLYDVNIKNNFYIKFGLGSGYSAYNITNQGIISNWINFIEYHYIPARLILGFEYKNILDSPISCEILATPSYMFNIYQKTDAIILSNNTNDLKILNLILGIKYTFKQI